MNSNLRVMQTRSCRPRAERYNQIMFTLRATIGTAIGLFVFALLAMTAPAFAHTTGSSWNVPSGPYTVDVGYDPITFVAGQYTRFDFLLWKGPANTSPPAPFDQVWIRIQKEDDTLLATGILKQSVGPTTLLYEFTQPGSYTLEASYRDADGNDIATSSFPITVEGGQGGTPILMPLMLFVIGAVVGGFIVLMRTRRR